MNEPIGTSKPLLVSNTETTSFWARMVRRVRSWFEFPYGYQDEDGFHFGTPPVPEKVLSLSATNVPHFTDRADAAISNAVSPTSPCTAREEPALNATSAESQPAVEVHSLRPQ